MSEQLSPNKSMTVGEVLDYLQSQGLDSNGCVCSALNALVLNQRNSQTLPALKAAAEKLGMVVVPKEPTDAMIEAMWEVERKQSKLDSCPDYMRDKYRAITAQEGQDD